jgi:hypothetical protein
VNKSYTANAGQWQTVSDFTLPLHSVYIGRLPDPSISVPQPGIYFKFSDNIPRGPYYAGQSPHLKDFVQTGEQLPELQIMCPQTGIIELDFNGSVCGAPLSRNMSQVPQAATLTAVPTIMDLITVNIPSISEIWINHANPTPYTQANVTAILETAPGNGGKVDNCEMWLDEIIGLTDPTLQSGLIQVINSTKIGPDFNWDPTSPSPAPILSGTANIEYGHGFRFDLKNLRTAALTAAPNFILRTIVRLV